MATPKQNPLIGSFRDPAPGEAPPGKADEKKLAEQGKTDPKAAGPVPPAKPEEKKPAEQGKADPKAAGATAFPKPEEKKPAEQDKSAGEVPAEPPKDPELRFVKIADITPLPGTYVKDTPRADYGDLIESIKKNGVNPIILRQGEKGGYQLVDGFHRYEALKRAGMLEIRADVYEMTIADASRYRKDHRKFPKLPILGRLIPYQPDPPAPAEKEAPDTPEAELPENLKIPLAPVDQPETVTRLKIADIRPFEGHPFNVTVLSLRLVRKPAFPFTAWTPIYTETLHETLAMPGPPAFRSGL